jgi:tetratricopeptide (TPR) repeat protein
MEVAPVNLIGFLFICVLASIIGSCFWAFHHEKVENRRAEEQREVGRREADRRENANFRQGQDALNRGDFDLALSCANEEIRRDPARIRGHRMRGEALHKKGMDKQAIEDYCRASDLDAEDSDLYRLRADSYAALHLYSRAITDYSDAIRLNPADAAAIEGRKAAYAARETHGDAPADDLPVQNAITAELPFTRAEDTHIRYDNDEPSQLIPRPAATIALGPAKVFNPLALTGFILGLTSVVLYVIGIIPILGIVFSAIGLGRFNPETQKAKWMAGWGLALSILFTIMYLTRH